MWGPVGLPWMDKAAGGAALGQQSQRLWGVLGSLQAPCEEGSRVTLSGQIMPNHKYCCPSFGH